MFRILVIFMLATGQMTTQLSQDTFPDRDVCKMVLPQATLAAGKYVANAEGVKDYSLGCVNQKEYKRVQEFLQRMNHEWKKKYGQTASYNSEGFQD